MGGPFMKLLKKSVSLLLLTLLALTLLPRPVRCEAPAVQAVLRTLETEKAESLEAEETAAAENVLLR